MMSEAGHGYGWGMMREDSPLSNPWTDEHHLWKAQYME